MKKIYPLSVGGGTRGYFFSVIHIDHLKVYPLRGAAALPPPPPPPLRGCLLFMCIYFRQNIPSPSMAYPEYVYVFRSYVRPNNIPTR